MNACNVTAPAPAVTRKHLGLARLRPAGWRPNGTILKLIVGLTRGHP